MSIPIYASAVSLVIVGLMAAGTYFPAFVPAALVVALALAAVLLRIEWSKPPVTDIGLAGKHWTLLFLIAASAGVLGYASICLAYTILAATKAANILEQAHEQANDSLEDHRE